MKLTKSVIDLKECEDFIKLVEAQRDLVYHLQKYKEALELRLKELEMIKQKAEKVVALKHKFRNVKDKIFLTEEERKAVNNILQARHIKI